MVHCPPLWQEILERPHDDAPRLRYADWLDLECDPLGEFIRVQCRLERLAPDQPDVLELETRERELLAEFEDEWVGDIADMVAYWVFRRGFVHEIATSAAQFLEHAAQLFQLAPIQEVHLGQARDAIEYLADSKYLERARYLDLSNNSVRDQGARALAQSSRLSEVRGLNLSSSGIGDQGFKALAFSPYLGQLRELYLSDNRISSGGVRALVASPLADRLELLHLRFNFIGQDGAELLQKRFGARVCL